MVDYNFFLHFSAAAKRSSAAAVAAAGRPTQLRAVTPKLGSAGRTAPRGRAGVGARANNAQVGIIVTLSEILYKKLNHRPSLLLQFEVS